MWRFDDIRSAEDLNIWYNFNLFYLWLQIMIDLFFLLVNFLIFC